MFWIYKCYSIQLPRLKAPPPAAGAHCGALLLSIPGIPDKPHKRKITPTSERARQREVDIAARMIASDEGETVEWVNMCIRKSWRVYQRGLERWFTDLLQPVFDGLLEVRQLRHADQPMGSK